MADYSRMLRENASLLTRTKPDKYESPYQGRVGAVLQNGDFFMYTADRTPLLQPQLSSIRVRVREDYRFGEHDFTQWPQPLSPNLPHLSCIRTRFSGVTPEYERLYARLRWDPTPMSLETVPGAVGGLGALREIDFVYFDTLQDGIENRVAQFKAANPRTLNSEHKSVTILYEFLGELYARLQLPRLSYEQMRLAVVAYQRCFLELLAVLDWFEIFLPKIMGLPPTTDKIPPLQDLIGVFVWDINDSQRFKKAGIPHWRIAPAADMDRVEIAELGPVVTPSLGTPMASRSPLYEGPMSRQVHKAILAFTQDVFKTANPFEISHKLDGTSRSNPGLSRRGLTTSASTLVAGRRQNAPYERQPSRAQVPAKPDIPEERFHYSTHQFMPRVPSCWSDALAQVRRDRLPRTVVVGTPLPEPHLFLGVKDRSEVTIMKYIFNWLKLRPAFLFCLSSSTTGGQLVIARLWRDIIHGKTGAGAGSHSSRLQELLANASDASGVKIAGPGLTAAWRRTTLTSDLMIGASITTEVLAEIATINFRLELQAVDREQTGKIREDVNIFLIGTAVGDILHVDFNKPPHPIVSDTPSQRKIAILGLRDLMMAWLYRPSGRSTSLTVQDVMEIPDNNLVYFEREVLEHYTQAVYLTLGKVAALPVQFVSSTG